MLLYRTPRNDPAAAAERSVQSALLSASRRGLGEDQCWLSCEASVEETRYAPKTFRIA